MTKPRAPGDSADIDAAKEPVARAAAGQEDSTLPPKTLTVTLDPRREDATSVFALVVLWCRDEASRAGEALLIPPGRAWIFGRGEVGSSQRRVGLVRQRPGRAEPTGPLRCPRISREQLEL